MKRPTPTLATGLLALAALAAPAPPAGPAATARAADPPTLAPPVTVPHSRQFDLRSAEGRPYRIFVAEPKDPAPASGYAVLYVLDANAMFLTTLDAVRFQHGLVPAVVVGVGYPSDALDQARRYWDFTPVTPAEHLLHSSTEPPVPPGGTGGQDQFLRFVREVLKPEVARRYPVDPGRQAIFGHSLAGRFVLHALFTQPDTFRDYIAASPSIWWDDGSIRNEAESFPPAAAGGRGVLVTVGEYEQRAAPGTPPPRADFLARARMVDNARALADRLRTLSPGLRVSFVEFPDENHGSVVPFAVSRAVRFALRAAPEAGAGKGMAKP